jgi:stage IV sporulation protein FB
MFSTGYYTLGNVRGAPVRIHWSAPLGAIAFTGFTFSPGLWAGFFLLVILHELGHAALVRRFGYQVVAVRVHAFGGDCQWAGNPTRAEVAVVAWGGVLAQAALWVAASVLLLVLGEPTSPVLWALAMTFTHVNARMILLNLMPIPPLDGHLAWPLIPMLWEARKEQQEHRRARREQQQARTREAAREKARTKVEKEMSEIDAAGEDPASMPDEVKAVLERVMKKERERRDRGGR